MHPSVIEWVRGTLTSGDIAGKTVLEVGSCNVNGSVRHLFEALRPARYLGVDVEDGIDVDQVVDCERLVETVGGGWDVVVSTEMLEHVRDWRGCMRQLALAVKPGGLLIITTRSPGFPYHAFPEDHWRFTPDLMGQIMAELDFDAYAIPDTDPHSPGVFAIGRKSQIWSPDPDSLCCLHAEPVTI